MKTVWYLKVDRELNQICGTDVVPKEEFVEWRPWNSWQNAIQRRQMYTLNKRLVAVFEEQVSRHGCNVQQRSGLRDGHESSLPKNELTTLCQLDKLQTPQVQNLSVLTPSAKVKSLLLF